MLEIILDLLANNAVLLQEHVSTDVVHGSLPKAAAALGVGLAALGAGIAAGSFTHLTLRTILLV